MSCDTRLIIVRLVLLSRLSPMSGSLTRVVYTSLGVTECSLHSDCVDQCPLYLNLIIPKCYL